MHLSHFLSKYRAIFEKRLCKKGLNGSMIFSTMTLTMDDILRLFIVHKKCKNSAKTEIKMYSRFFRRHAPDVKSSHYSNLFNLYAPFTERLNYPL